MAAAVAAGVVLTPAAAAQLSDEAALTSLEIESDLRQTRMFPEFNPRVTRYDVAVPSGETEVTVTVTLSHSAATVEVTTAAADGSTVEWVDPDPNTGQYTVPVRTDRRATPLTVTVTAEDGVTKMSYVAYLSAASLSEKGWRVYNDLPLDRLLDPMLDPQFDPEVDESELPSHYVEGLWADDSTLRVSAQVREPLDRKVFAFDAADSSRRPLDDFYFGTNPYGGIWSDGTTLWSMEDDGRLRPFDLLTGASLEYEVVCRTDSQGDCELDGNGDPIVDRTVYNGVDVSPGPGGNHLVSEPRGIWSDETTFWVVDRASTKVFAFKLPEFCANGTNYCRESSKDFDLDPENDAPWGITAGKSRPTASEIDTWWVTDTTPSTETVDGEEVEVRKLYAYNRSDGTRNSALDFDLTQLKIRNLQQFYYGLAATDEIMYVAEYITGRVYSLNMPGHTPASIAPALASDDATLSTLTVNDGSADVDLVPPFTDAEHTFYSAEVEPDISSVTVTATPNHSSATVKIDGTISTSSAVTLGAEGSTTAVAVEVTAQDGITTKTYDLNISVRESSGIATLQSLTVTDHVKSAPDNVVTLTPAFDPEKDAYTATVPNAVDRVTVTATPSDLEYFQSVEINGTDVTESSHALVVDLIAQEIDNDLVNTITVEVTAEDGTAKTYGVEVVRERALSDVATLDQLVLTYAAEEVELDPAFVDPEESGHAYSFDAEVAYGVSSLVVKYVPSDANVERVDVRIGGAQDQNGAVAGERTESSVRPSDVDDTTVLLEDLLVGENTLTVEVWAENCKAESTIEDCTAKQSYVVSIERLAASDDATLESLSIDPGTVNEVFQPSTALYTASVLHDDATTVLSITPTDGDTATVVVKHGGTVEQDDSVSGGVEVTAVPDPDDDGVLTYTIPLAAPSLTQAAETRVTIEVFAESYDSATNPTAKNLYVVDITRPVDPATTDATLDTLALKHPKSDIDIALSTVSDTYYTASVGNSVDQVKVVAVPTNQAGATLQLQVGGVVVQDAASQDVDKDDLAGGVIVDLDSPGTYFLAVVVTAENGTTTKTYNVEVTRDARPLRTDTTLYNLVLRDVTQTPVTLDPVFIEGGQNATEFTASVAHGVTKLEVIPTATDGDGAEVAVTVGGTVVGGIVTGGTDDDVGGFVPLDTAGGDNVIHVLVTAEDDMTTGIHTVTVTREAAPADDVATLSSLTLDGIALDFDSDTLAYTASVANSVDSTTVRAVATSANATVTASLGSTASTSNTSEVVLSVGLAVGPNAISVEVTSEDGQVSQTYTVTVTRAGPPSSNTGGGTNTGGSTGVGFSTLGGGSNGGPSNSGSSGTDDGSGTTATVSTSGTVTPIEDVDDAGADHQADINELHRLGTFASTLCGTSRLCPDDDMARWIAAVWLVRLIDGDDPDPVTASRFADVNASENWEESMWFAPHVERLADLGITAGCAKDPLKFCPDAMLRKAEAATWLVRAFDLPSASSQGFVDAVGSAHEDTINQAVAAGVMEGCSTDPKHFCLDDNVTRGEMASYVNKARKVTSS